MAIDLFTDSLDEIEVKVYLGVSTKHNGRIYADIDRAKLIETGGADLDTSAIEEHSFYFRSPSFGDSNKILERSVKMDENGVNISPSEMRYERLATLLTRWTLKGKDGTDIKPNRDNLKKLNLVVATVVSLELEFQLQQRGVL